MKKSVIDKLDMNILELLEEDCSLSYQEIATRVDGNIWTVRDRVLMLKKRGILKQCKAELDYALMGFGCKAILFFNVSPENIDSVIRYIKTQKTIKRLTIMTGDRRFMAEIVGKDCNSIRNFVRDNLVEFKIYNTQFEVVLEEPK